MITRRGFVGSTLGAAALTAASSQLARPQGARKRMIVDAQIHLWKAESEDWKWVPNAKPQLPEPFTVERALPLMDEAGVERAVVVPPSWHGDRNDYALEAVKRYPSRFAVMGRIALQDPKSAALLPGWKSQPGMLGIRLTFLGPAAKWLEDGTADWFWPEAEKAAIPIMFLAVGKGAQMARIAEKYPGLQLIADHMGMSLSDEAVRAGKFDGPIGDVLALAKYPNVSVKLSGSANYSRQPYPYADLNPHIRRLFEAYGPQRSYWGTDITNGAFGQATYRQRIAHFTEALDFMSEDDKDWVMGRGITARLKWA
ncbi:MAG: amidohydrolase family protein [Alphaproteobacteria bacterium]